MALIIFMSSPIVFPTENQSSIPILAASGHLWFSLSSPLLSTAIIYDLLRNGRVGIIILSSPVSGQGHLNCVMYPGLATVYG